MDSKGSLNREKKNPEAIIEHNFSWLVIVVVGFCWLCFFVIWVATLSRLQGLHEAVPVLVTTDSLHQRADVQRQCSYHCSCRTECGFDLYERIAKRLWNSCNDIHRKQRGAGNREVLVSFREQHVIPLPVLCTLCHPSVPEETWLQNSVIFHFSLLESLLIIYKPAPFPYLTVFCWEAHLCLSDSKEDLWHLFICSVEDRMLSKKALGFNPLWPFLCYRRDWELHFPIAGYPTRMEACVFKV